MSRPLRIELADGLYHVTSRGNRRESIYWDDDDRQCWLDVLARVCVRKAWRVHAWCQMSNHYHLVVETPQANLSDGMRQLNGVYTQRSNTRHGRCGHVFQGRFHAVLMERQTHLLEVVRYVVLNPVRAGLVTDPAHWRWSSYRMTTGITRPPPWLDTQWTLAQFGNLHAHAVARYVRFVQAGIAGQAQGAPGPHPSAIGSPNFVMAALTKGHLAVHNRDLTEISRASRCVPAPSLAQFQSLYPNRSDAMAKAYATGSYSMREIANHFGVHRTTVSKAVGSLERAQATASHDLTPRPSTGRPTD